eukprot:1062643-Rhodomonas_salina.1
MNQRRNSSILATSPASYAASASTSTRPRDTRCRTLLTQQRKGMLRMSATDVCTRSRTTEALAVEGRSELRRVLSEGVGGEVSVTRSTRTVSGIDASSARSTWRGKRQACV